MFLARVAMGPRASKTKADSPARFRPIAVADPAGPAPAMITGSFLAADDMSPDNTFALPIPACISESSAGSVSQQALAAKA